MGLVVKLELEKQIIDNLQLMHMSEEYIQKILQTVEAMPAKEHVLGALKFLTQITDQKSKREAYYIHSNYLAEYFCTLSNIGLFAVGYFYNDFSTLLAATFSALSHAIPSQRLHDLDMMGIFLIFGKAVANYKMIMKRPDVIAWGATALTINVMDTVITRNYLDEIGPGLHVTWHIAAALALYKFNQAQLETTDEEIQNIMTSVTSNTVPNFLTDAYQEVTNYLYDFNCMSACTIL